MAPAELERILGPIRATFQAGNYPDLLVGLTAADDAAVYQINATQAVVSTVDFFPPIVDDPYDFGAIAAANALSDVYAMGGEVLFAVNLVAFPDSLDRGILAEILRGGAEKVAEAGAVVVGGHSVNDREPKYGLAVTGVAKPDELVYNGGAEPGDRLVLTKRLGIGVLASGLKKGIVTEAGMMGAIEEAAALNAAAATAMARVGVHACTDVSGFGLAGHLGEMLDASQAAAELRLAAVPLHDGVLDLIAQQVYAGGLRSNREFLLPRLREAGPAGAAGRLAGPLAGQDPRVLALFDPQTSGGLLMAVAPEKHGLLLDALAQVGAGAWTVGQVVDGPTGVVAIEE